jgi:membrane fusion protein (multidrug efflux system)
MHMSLLAGPLLLAGCGEDEAAQQAPPPPPSVTVAAVAAQDVTPTAAFNGRVEAVDQVELRARVEGFIEQRLFEEGADVRAGDLLIVLEKGPYEADIGELQGRILAAEGTLRLAEIEVERKSTLVERRAVAQQQLDEANAQHSQALGALRQLQAALAHAELNLSYTDIRAPMDGRIGRFAFSVGDYVSASSDPLAVIVSQDPMHVTFPVSARELLEVRRAAEAAGRDPRAVRVKIRLPDGTIYDQIGTIDFLDVRTEPTTDTVIVRATVPNPQRLLVADQLVGVIIEESQARRELVIPQAAVAVDQAGPYVLVVGADGAIEQRRVRLGSQQGADIAVAEGLREGENVVVEGLQKVRPGQVVAATTAASVGM